MVPTKIKEYCESKKWLIGFDETISEPNGNKRGTINTFDVYVVIRRNETFRIHVRVGSKKEFRLIHRGRYMAFAGSQAKFLLLLEKYANNKLIGEQRQ